MTRIIGLTGGIGSGKTTVANYIKSFGIPVYIADDAAKEVMETEEAVLEIKKEFGEDVFENGKLDRKKISKLVFNNPEKLQKLNAIVHPLVKRHFEEWLKKHHNAPFIVKEAAILFESGTYKNCDSIITVIAPIEDRIKRVMQRDNTDRKSVLERMKNQWTDAERIAKSDFVIYNRSVNETQKETESILKILKNQ